MRIVLTLISGITGWANTEHFHVMPENSIVHRRSSSPLDVRVDRKRQVVHAAAPQTSYVIVPARVAIEPRGMRSGLDRFDEPFGRKLAQVPVHGPEADFRQPAPRLTEDPIGGRVVHRRSNDVENDGSLASLPGVHS